MSIIIVIEMGKKNGTVDGSEIRRENLPGM